jgi:hypothetical protein
MAPAPESTFIEGLPDPPESEDGFDLDLVPDQTGDLESESREPIEEQEDDSEPKYPGAGLATQIDAVEIISPDDVD